jgi:glycosyltransferase involved in cell wall biosynthesis
MDMKAGATDKLRIVHVVVSLERGGLERLVTDLAIEQHEAGHHVAVFSINATQGFASVLQDAGVEVVVGNKRRGFDLGVLSALRGLVRRRDANVVHAHNFVPNYYAATALLGLGKGVVLIGTCHDMGTRLVNKRLRWFFELSLLRTAKVAMVGRQVYQRFVEGGIVPAGKAATVLNAVPLARFGVPGAGRHEARAELGLPDDALVIGCVGRLVGLKNHKLVIGLMPLILREYPSARLVLLGGGELMDDLRRQAEALGLADRVMLAGERPQVAHLLAALDVFVMPSLTEGVSIALLEACAAGLPAVATDVGGNPEIIASGERGLLVPAEDADATLDAIRSLLASPALRQEYGRKAREWVVAHASLHALRVRYDQLYRDALARQS